MDLVVTKSDSVVKHFTVGAPKLEMWSSCTSSNSGGEGNWLNCLYPPGTPPNTGMYFSPKFYMDFAVAQATDGDLSLLHEIEYVVDFRGAK